MPIRWTRPRARRRARPGPRPPAARARAGREASARRAHAAATSWAAPGGGPATPAQPRAAAACPLRTAPSIVAGHRCRSTRRPARGRAARSRAPGAGRAAPGPARNVAACSRVTKKCSIRASRAGGQQLGQRRHVAGLQVVDASCRARASAADSETARYWPGSSPALARAVEDPLHRRAHAGRERVLEHRPVVDHVEVDDRRAPQPGQRGPGRRPRRPAAAGRARSWGTATITASASNVGAALTSIRKPSGAGDDRRRAVAQADLDAGPPEGRRGRPRRGCRPSGTRGVAHVGRRRRPESSPTWKTCAAWASEASSGTRLSVGRPIRLPHRVDRRGPTGRARPASRRTSGRRAAGRRRPRAAAPASPGPRENRSPTERKP